MPSNRWKRIITEACFFAVFAIAVICPARGQDVSKAVKSARGAVVTLYTENLENEPGIGTGFFIDQTHIVTVRHNLARTLRMMYRFKGGPPEPIAGVTGENIAGDLVELLIDTAYSDGSNAFLWISSEGAEKGEPIVVIGSPYGKEFTITKGIVSAIRSMPWQDSLLQVTAPTSAGSSGSPVMNTAGDVVGILQAMDSGSANVANYAYAIRASCLRFLKPISFVSIPRYSRDVEDWPDGYYDYTDQSGNYAVSEELQKKARDIYDSGVVNFSNHNWRAALKFFRQADTLHHTGATSYMVGQCSFVLGMFHWAMDAYRQAAPSILSRSDSLHTVSLLASLGRTSITLGWWDSAIHYFDQVLVFNQKDEESLVGIGRSYYHLRKDSDAMIYFKRTISYGYYSPEAYYFIGMIDFRRDRFPEAEAETRQAISLMDHPMFSGGLGDVLWHEGRTDEAVAAFHKCIEGYRNAANIDDVDEYRDFVTSLAEHNLWREQGDALMVEDQIRDLAEAHKKSLNH